MTDLTKQKQTIRVRTLRPHSKDCYAIKNTRDGSWSNPWAYLAEPIYRDAIGRNSKGSHYRWLHLRCNCTHCPGRLLVCEADILELLPHG